MKTQDADSDERRDEWKSMELAILACNCAAQHCTAMHGLIRRIRCTAVIQRALRRYAGS